MGSPSLVKVTVRLGEPLWRRVGKRRLTLEVPSQADLEQVAVALARRYPELSVLFTPEGRAMYRLFVNGQHVPWDRLDGVRVQDQDTVYIFPPAAGGDDFRRPLPRSFYDRHTLHVARDLLGSYLVRELNGTLLVARILETEAYVGPDDKASHAAVGLTPRNAAMFGPPGHAYVYLIYGMHRCLNVVTERVGYPAAVLIRAGEPMMGLDLMRTLRGGRSDDELLNGPAKLCQAMAIDLRLNGHDLCVGRDLWLAAGERVPDDVVITGPRVGVRGDRRARTVPWRFAIRGHPGVSKPYPWRSKASRRRFQRA